LGPVPGEDPWLNRAARGGLDWLQNIGFETSRSSEGCASLTTVIDPFEFVHQRADALDQRSKQLGNAHGKRFTPASIPTRSNDCASSQYTFFAFCQAL
jgi:hypothetical protein